MARSDLESSSRRRTYRRSIEKRSALSSRIGWTRSLKRCRAQLQQLCFRPPFGAIAGGLRIITHIPVLRFLFEGCSNAVGTLPGGQIDSLDRLGDHYSRPKIEHGCRPGDSAEQRECEPLVIALVSERLGCVVTKKRISLPSGAAVEVDGCSDDPASRTRSQPQDRPQNFHPHLSLPEEPADRE